MTTSKQTLDSAVMVDSLLKKQNLTMGPLEEWKLGTLNKGPQPPTLEVLMDRSKRES